MMKALGILLVVMLLSLVVAGVAGADTAQPAAAQAQTSMVAGEYQDVSDIQPFSAEANFMSLAGYLRWTVLRDQHVLLSRVEAQRIVTAQKA